MTPGLTSVDESPIDPEAMRLAVSGADVGASVVFVGTVRDHDPDAQGTVVSLVYSAHPSADEKLAAIVADVVAGTQAQVRVSARHRVGTLSVGEVAFAVATAAGHRAEAFAVCTQVVERVKAELPIWKQQFEADGSSQWLGL